MPVSGLSCLISYRLEEHSCTLRKGALKGCQCWSSPLSLRTVFQWILFTNSLKSWKFAVAKFRVLTLLPSTLTLLEITDFKIWAWKDLRAKKEKNKEGNIWWPYLSPEKYGNVQDRGVMLWEEQRPGNARQVSSLSKNQSKNGSWRWIHLWCCEQITEPCLTSAQDSWIGKLVTHTEDSPQHAKSTQLCIPEFPLSFIKPLLCLRSIKALHFPERKNLLSNICNFKAEFYFFFFNAPALSNMQCNI